MVSTPFGTDYPGAHTAAEITTSLGKVKPATAKWRGDQEEEEEEEDGSVHGLISHRAHTLHGSPSPLTFHDPTTNTTTTTHQKAERGRINPQAVEKERHLTAARRSQNRPPGMSHPLGPETRHAIHYTTLSSQA